MLILDEPSEPSADPWTLLTDNQKFVGSKFLR